MKNNDIKEVWWKEGVTIFVKVSSYIVFPIIIASFAGKYFDNKYNTGSSIFYILIAIAFLSTIYLIWREMKIYKKKLNKEENQIK